MVESILGKKIELMPRELKPNQISCPKCEGIGWLHHIEGEQKWISQCLDCYNGAIDVCSECGQPFEFRYVHTCKNPECVKKEKDKRIEEKKEIEKQRIEKAVKVICDNPFEKFSMLYSEIVCYNEGYFDDWNTFFDAFYSLDIEEFEYFNRHIEKPEYVWGTCCTKLSMDADLIIEQATDDLWEGARDNISGKDVKELQDFLDGWCAKQTGTNTYIVDYKYAVRIPWEIYDGKTN